MKALNTIVKILTALATVAGAVYIIATYGEQIVAWCKKTLEALPKCPKCEEAPEVEVEITVEEAAEEVAAEEVVVEEAAEEAAPAEEAPAAEADEPVADEADFAE